MSHAFDAINIEKILDVLTSAVCETDNLRLVFTSSRQELRFSSCEVILVCLV